MNLDDRGILELNELCSALVDGTINENQAARLSQWLATSEAARRYYVRTIGLSASLFSYAGEMQTAEPERAAWPETIIHLSWLRKINWWWQSGLLATAAAAIALVAWITWPGNHAGNNATVIPAADVFVAQLSGLKDCQWAENGSAVQLGDRLHKGQRLELVRGFAEITFDSGAQVVLQGPASFDVNSAWGASLNRGALKASTPPEATGFSISNPTVEVVDLGTEFTMFADDIGAATEVLVLKGEVEAQPKTDAEKQQPIVLRAKESRRFAASGVSSVDDSEQKFAQFTRVGPLDHFIPATDYLHWSFDETDSGVFKADASGTLFEAADLRLENVSPTATAAAHVPGHRDLALKFDGHFFARAALPDISKNTPHTVVFWVKVPTNASLFNAYAMVAWSMNNIQSGSHPVHIGWNRNPNEGTLGVLRTDYGGGYALGSTPVRDGRWHHIAVVLIPGEEGKTTVQVKQYVDGRLEGEGKSSPPGSDIFTKLSSSTGGAIWFGCRLGINGVRQERFCGEMDELFIANRALKPLEIVGLMNYNQLPQSELAKSNQ
jgi:ferric-dicitrate binding protein FerR (iron transport regulator)